VIPNLPPTKSHFINFPNISVELLAVLKESFKSENTVSFLQIDFLYNSNIINILLNFIENFIQT